MARNSDAVAALAMIMAAGLGSACGDKVTGPGAGSLVFTDIAASVHTCALTLIGSAYCWGGSQLTGVGDGNSDVLELRLSPVPVVGGLIFSGITVGSQHTCGWTLDGTAYCWGGNAFRQLGSDPLDGGPDGLDPKLVTGDVSFAQIVAGTRTTCGRTSLGLTYCWGSNEYGALGSGQTFLFSHTPLEIGGLNSFTDIAMGWWSACGITITGVGRCWGRNNGHLGDGTMADRSTPVTVTGNHSWVQIAVGNAHSCGITTTSGAYCWGIGLGHGALGTGQQENSFIPKSVTGGHAFVQLGVGLRHTCGRTNFREVYCWGDNGYGQLGDGTESVRSYVPVKVSGTLRFQDITVGDWHTCGIADSGYAYCWGYGRQGELGNGTDAIRRVPTAVR